MRVLSAVFLLLVAAPAQDARYFHYERPLAGPMKAGGQTCIVVDPAVFAHASSQLADLRLYQGSSETPYVLRDDTIEVSGDERVGLMNPGRSDGKTVFDAEMPSHRYSDLDLDVAGRDFLATVTISGSRAQNSAATMLGDFTIFDLTSQKLGRSTVLHLPDSDFPFLHFKIAGPLAPDSIKGLTVTRLLLAKPEFAGVAETANTAVKNRNSVFEFTMPPHTPVDRIEFLPGNIPANFSRDVRISVLPVLQRAGNDSEESPQPVTASGNILRVHSVRDGHLIDESRLAVDAPQVDFASTAKWTVVIENGDDPPVQMNSVRLEMFDRRLCFDAIPGALYTLYYGDAALAAPRYDYARLFVLGQDPNADFLGAEIANPAYEPRPDGRPFTERHPALMWIALIIVIALLGLIGIRSFKGQSSQPS